MRFGFLRLYTVHTSDRIPFRHPTEFVDDVSLNHGAPSGVALLFRVVSYELRVTVQYDIPSVTCVRQVNLQPRGSVFPLPCPAVRDVYILQTVSAAVR